MNTYILDTNVFFNMVAGFELGTNTETVAEKIATAGQKLKQNGGGLYISPRIREEILSFFENQDQPFIRTLMASVIVKSPDISRLTIPAGVFYELVEDIRFRNLRGVAIAEEELLKVPQMHLDPSVLSKKDMQLALQPVIHKLRERYRNATRFGFLDSLGDLDIIMLGLELNAPIVTTDEGLLHWGRKFGVVEISPSGFGEAILGLISK